jgi:hypothetical protein
MCGLLDDPHIIILNFMSTPLDTAARVLAVVRFECGSEIFVAEEPAKPGMGR